MIARGLVALLGLALLVAVALAANALDDGPRKGEITEADLLRLQACLRSAGWDTEINAEADDLVADVGDRDELDYWADRGECEARLPFAGPPGNER